MTTNVWRNLDAAIRPSWDPAAVAAAAGTGFVVLVGSYLVANDRLLRLPLAAGLVILLVGLANISPRATLYTVVGWLAVLGFVRRVVSDIAAPTSADALLLVAPAGLIVVLLVAAKRGAFEGRTRLALAVGALLMIAFLSALNPLQGGLTTGIAGLLFVPVPLLAFFIGRSSIIDDKTFSRLLLLMAGLAIGAAVYGLFQTLHGFPSWDRAWINQVIQQYTALNVQVAGTIRPFSTFSSAAEFGYYLGIAIVVWFIRGLGLFRLPLTAAAIALLGTALIYESSRQVIFTLAVAFGLMLGAWRHLRFGLAVALAALLVIGVPFAASKLTNGGGQRNGLLVSHQVQGLQNPLDPHHSTGRVHLSLVMNGVKSAIHQPLGYGVGATNNAGTKFARVQRNTEADPSNAAVAFGLPGLLLYGAILVLALSGAYRLARIRRDWLAFAALGVLGVTLSQWLTGGQYAVAFVPWLVMGWVDRRLREGEAEAPGPAA